MCNTERTKNSKLQSQKLFIILLNTAIFIETQSCNLVSKCYAPMDTQPSCYLQLMTVSINILSILSHSIIIIIDCKFIVVLSVK